MKAVFLDRDGTTIVDPPDHRVDSLEKLELSPDTVEALKALSLLDYGVLIISNQAGIAEGRITEEEFWVINDKFLEMIQPSHLKIIKTYICPHPESAGCVCHKPKPGMLLQAAEEFDIDLANSWIVGDRQSDILAGTNAGTRTILVETGNSPVTSTQATHTASDLAAAVDYIKSHNS